MRILHTSDWHLGKKLEGRSRHEEQVEVLEEICRIADRENVHAVLVAGDLFDGYNPPTESIELFYRTLKRLADEGRRAVIAIAGNHDSPERIEAPDPLARECGIIFAGFPTTSFPPFRIDSGLELVRSSAGFLEIRIPATDELLRVLFTPYANEYRLKTYLGEEDSEEELRRILHARWKETAAHYMDHQGVNLLVSHLYFMKEGGEQPEEPDDEKPILHIGGAQALYSNLIPDCIQYAALGHLHRKQVVDAVPCPVVYSGGILEYSFAETNQKKYVVVAEICPGGEAAVKSIELAAGKKLLRKKFNDIDSAVRWLQDNPSCLVELTMVSETYLTSMDRKRLTDAHDGIITIIPEVLNKELQQVEDKTIDPGRTMVDLFREYFKHRKGQEPNDRIVELFREVIGTGPENE